MADEPGRRSWAPTQEGAAGRPPLENIRSCTSELLKTAPTPVSSGCLCALCQPVPDPHPRLRWQVALLCLPFPLHEMFMDTPPSHCDPSCLSLRPPLIPSTLPASHHRGEWQTGTADEIEGERMVLCPPLLTRRRLAQGTLVSDDSPQPRSLWVTTPLPPSSPCSPFLSCLLSAHFVPPSRFQGWRRRRRCANKGQSHSVPFLHHLEPFWEPPG